jgi:hypothetical protein
MGNIISMPGKGCHAHKMVAGVAREMAAAVYERCARNNEWFAENPSQDDYVRDAWPLFLEQARATLAQMLGGQLDEELKKQIHAALILDGSLRRGRMNKLQAKMGLN